MYPGVRDIGGGGGRLHTLPVPPGPPGEAGERQRSHRGRVHREDFMRGGGHTAGSQSTWEDAADRFLL